MQPLPSVLLQLTPLFVVGVFGCVVAFFVARPRRPLVLTGAVLVVVAAVLRLFLVLVVLDPYAVATPDDPVFLFTRLLDFGLAAGILLMAVGALRPTNDGTAHPPTPGWRVAPGGTSPTYSPPPGPHHGPDGRHDFGGRQ
ncbi:hypothetical protein J4H86_26275 [Spiractinospora alimapuensis]|uniref:hypothetical protein n=1 Tax=Spiractinospora alimapuensis TaxID=2820884 RepID=UPI001F2721CB|nr:hypothetical protein [Spiractinospora alimapuensis]QVQ52164.1 hypothetical protein J4H86_26275 [Spiractinospora alimapuensis]